MRYRKKPVVIEAIKWTGENRDEIKDFVKKDFSFHTDTQKRDCVDLYIFTLEGHHKANVGDMIIKGVKGEFYPCKPDIFEMTYEPEQSHESEKDSV